MTEFDDECTWFPFRVTARGPQGEVREQVWLARDADHALERADRDPDKAGVMRPCPDSATAERVYADD